MEEPSPVLPTVIEVKKKKVGETKFIIGIDDLTTTTPQQQQQQLPPPEGITNNAVGVPLRRPYRHHVKRRIGRMNMVKAQNLTDSEAEVNNKNTVTTVDMRRSQSQRSLLPRQQQYQPQPRRSLTQQLPFALDDQQQEQQRRNSTNSYNSIRRNSPAHYFVSQQQMAAPIEQTFNAVANNLVAPNGAAYPACVHAASSPVISSPTSPRRRQPATSSLTPTKPLLRSQFITNNYNSKSNKSNQQQENDKEETLYISRERTRINNEYQFLKQYRDPMRESLVRCMRIRNNNNNKRHPPLRSSTYHASSAYRTMSTSTIVTPNNYNNNDSNLLLHSGHRQIAAAARRQQQQKQQRQQLTIVTAHNNGKNFVSSPTNPNRFSSASSSSTSSSLRSEWNKEGGIFSALWDRMMPNVNS
ncbi:hypothetical protein INT45_001189 [Circinella minor]|uniref:Uncharacterized protein n=1 Tax=Circinella minor TaxID=1195481 RepID=A0A8H7VNZ2_9FUNG|nr:hypothetical protein INT45_001189 [Circinella minor]